MATTTAPTNRRRNDHVTVRVESLCDGQQLICPIWDKSGTLLLAAGSTVTAKFKRLLADRGIETVALSLADARNLSVSAETVIYAGESRTAPLVDADLAAKLDSMIDEGHLLVEEGESRLKDLIENPGCQSYGLEQQNRLQEELHLKRQVLSETIKAAARGKVFTPEQIANVVSDYLREVTADSACVLDVLQLTPRYVDLAEHCLQMSVLGMVVAIEMGMSARDVRNVGLAGLLHDFGMTLVPPHILDANRPLTDVEFLEIQKHPIYTLKLLQPMPGIPVVVPLICYQVHERPNGTGYPRQRQRQSIHPAALILNVVDAYLALIEDRPFRKALHPYRAMEMLIRQAGEKIVDVEPLRALLNVLSMFPIGTIVRLSDGSKARVLRRNGDHYNAPIVQIIEDVIGTYVDPLDETSIIDPLKEGLTVVGVLAA
jgi:HD-GYP domain-containing protein (c-di-GMP phosphodiesterase class II)